MTQTSSGDRLPTVGAGTGLSLILLLLFTNYMARPIGIVRTAAQSIEWAAPNAEQQIPARLWQDPLATAYDAVRQNLSRQPPSADGKLLSSSFGMPAPRTLEDLRTSIQRSAVSRVEIFAMLVPGGSSGDAQETRVRTRVAVVSGVGTCG
jgi:hypothetical protein